MCKNLEKTMQKKDIRVKYLRDHISLTVGNLYMHSMSHIASNIVTLFVYGIFFKLLGYFFSYLGIYDT